MYRKALRSLVSLATSRIEREVFPLLEQTLPEPARRTDAADRSPLERLKAGIDEAELRFLRSGYRAPLTAYDPEKASSITFSQYPGEDLVLEDGRHRLEAAQRAGATEIRAVLREYDADGNLLRETPATIPVPRPDAAKQKLLSERTSAQPATSRELDARTLVRERLQAIKQALLGADRSALAQEVGERVASANAAEFKRVLKIDTKAMGQHTSGQLDTFRKTNVDLIKSIPETLLDQVDKTVEEAWTKGKRVEVLRAELQKRFEVSKSRADLIARDQVLKLNSQITKTRQTSAGIVEYVWTTSHDERVRGNPDGLYPDSDSDHYSLDGTRQRWDAPPVTNAKTGATNHPGEDYQCRCVAVPVLSFLDDPDLDQPE